jgi:hypothetical protein
LAIGGGFEGVEQWGVKASFFGTRRHFHHDDGWVFDTGFRIKLSGKITPEPFDDFGFAHAAITVDQQAGHARTGAVTDQILQSIQGSFGLGKPDPAVSTNKLDAVGIRPVDGVVSRWRQMGQDAGLRGGHDSQISTLNGIGAWR